MRKSKIIVLIALVLLAGTIAIMAGNDSFIEGHKTLTIEPVASVKKVTVDFPISGYVYSDTIEGEVIEWTAPLQKMLIMPASFVDSMTFACSLNLSTEVLGFEYLKAESLALADLVDACVDSFNNVATLSDSVIASNQGDTAVLVTALFSSVIYGDEFVAVVGDSLDTVSVDPVTKAMVVDSMIKYIKANDSLDAWLFTNPFAAYYQLNSRITGDTILLATDTAQTPTTLQEPLLRRTTYSEYIGSVANCYGIKGYIVIPLSTYETSAIETLVVVLKSTMGGWTTNVCSTFATNLPCTAKVGFYTDTLLLQGLRLDVTWADSHYVPINSSMTTLLQWWLKLYGENPVF
jgi:hypothetical protein